MATQTDIEPEEAFARKRMSKETFMRLTKLLRPYRGAFALNLLFTICATASQLLGPKLIQVGIDRFLTNFSSAQAALEGILLVSALYLGNLLLGWGLTAGQVKSAIAVGQRAMNDLRMEVFEHIQRVSLNYFDRTHQGRILARADTDVDSLDRIMTWGANQLLGSFLTLVGVLVFMLQYDWRLCLAVSVVLPPLVIATRLFQSRALEAYRRLRAQTSLLTATMAENIAGVRVVQAFSRETENLSRFQQLHATHDKHALAAARVFHTYLPFLNLLAGIGTAIIIGYGGNLVMRHEITV